MCILGLGNLNRFCIAKIGLRKQKETTKQEEASVWIMKHAFNWDTRFGLTWYNHQVPGMAESVV